MKKLVCLLSLLAPVVVFVPTSHAQVLPPPGSGFDWERVGDIPIDADVLAFGPDGTLWGYGRGLYRLDATGGPAGTWILAGDDTHIERLLPLGPDTLLVAWSRVRRSTDGGASFDDVYARALLGLYRVPEGVPHAGRILTGDYPLAYSDDSGDTWIEGAGDFGGFTDFAALPASATHPGRVLAVGEWGISLSDDGGATLRESGLWQYVRYLPKFVATVEGGAPGGGVRAVAIGADAQAPGTRVWVSDDEGETWADQGVDLVGSSSLGGGLFWVGGRTLMVVTGDGVVHRSDDGGATWAMAGQAPEENGATRVRGAALGPAGRLYVGLSGGPEADWVYQTERLVPVASEPGPEAPAGLGLAVAPNPARGTAEVALTLAQPTAVTVSLYDGQGRRVAVLHEGPLSAGAHVLPINGADLSAGVYVVRATVGEAVASQRLTLLP